VSEAAHNPQAAAVASIVVMLGGAIAGARVESAGLGWATGAAAAFVIVGVLIATGTT
jgi:hypothetical protein